jgi:hypothetical protein
MAGPSTPTPATRTRNQKKRKVTEGEVIAEEVPAAITSAEDEPVDTPVALGKRKAGLRK